MEGFIATIIIMSLMVLAVYWSIQVKRYEITALFVVLSIISFGSICSMDLENNTKQSQELIASTQKKCFAEYKNEYNQVYKTEIINCD